jgi:hypothetical protein
MTYNESVVFEKLGSSQKIYACWRRRSTLALQLSWVGVVNAGDLVLFPGDAEPQLVQSVVIAPAHCRVHEADGLQYEEGTPHVVVTLVDPGQLNNFEYLKYRAKVMGLKLLGCVSGK